MPSITNQETVDAIAQEYCTNGLIKSKALKAVGYTNRYAETRGLKLYDNVRVKAAIAKVLAKLAAQTAFTTDVAQSEYEQARQLALKCNQPSAAVSATTGKARLYGMDKDNAVKPQAEAQLSDAERQALADLARSYKVKLTQAG
ncbi:hypothetical protein LCGC14_0972820 [marine sediment metagenome]|uniref:Uncharacterized protein n=1 Tax=marine sediment metagenome TaxID=412755 RepID=A0A0F9NB46_9ZZZZ